MPNRLGEYSYVPYMVKIAAYLNKTIPIVAERKRLLFDKYKLEHTKSVKADNTVRQASRANATNRVFYLKVRLYFVILTFISLIAGCLSLLVFEV